MSIEEVLCTDEIDKKGSTENKIKKIDSKEIKKNMIKSGGGSNQSNSR